MGTSNLKSSRKDALPVLVEGTRSGKVEVRHRGVWVLVNTDGEILGGAGDPTQFQYPRSALKYFQVLPLLESGAAAAFGFDEEEIALMCASHNAEARHLEVVRRIFEKTGLSPDSLSCGAHKPIGPAAYENWVRSGTPLLQLHNNCSGKHAGFLAMAKHIGAPLEGYLEFEHPVQQQIRALVSEMCGVSESEMTFGIDGCSAPNYGMSIHALATGFARLGKPTDLSKVRQKACGEVLKALSAHPFMVGGTGRYCTDMMELLAPKVIGKLGAAGVYGLSFPELGLGAAIKMEDGSTGPQYVVAQAIINAVLQRSHPELDRYLQVPLRNCNQLVIGELRLSPGTSLPDLMQH